MKSGLVVSMIMIGISVLFIVQNTEVVNIRLLFWSASLSAALLYFLLFTFGAVFGWILHSYSRHRKNAAKRL